MNTKQLEYVIALEQTGSFSKAADELGISQPSLSQYIKKIEKEIGLDLFDRSGGSLRLTDAGRVYIDSGRKILDIEHQMACEFSDISSFKSGTVYVGTTPFRSAAMLPKIVSAFRAEYKGINVSVIEKGTLELLEGVERGEFDVCITTLPIDEKKFQYKLISEEEILLAMPKSDASLDCELVSSRNYPAVDAKVIDNKPFVMVGEGQIMQKALNDLCFENGVSVIGVVTVKSLEALIKMVEEGVGWAIVPSGIEALCNKSKVDFYSFRQELPKRKVAVLWQKNRKQPEIIKKLISMICEN